jgi:hypothetical protein
MSALARSTVLAPAGAIFEVFACCATRALVIGNSLAFLVFRGLSHPAI